MFCWVCVMARCLLTISGRRTSRYLSEFCHAARPRCAVVRDGCAAITDQIEVVVTTNHRLQPEPDQPIRRIEWSRRFGESDPADRRKRIYADIAGDDERTARSARPVLDCNGIDDHPIGCVESPVLTTRRQQ